MAENPESLNALLRPPPGEDDAVEAMRRQIRVHEQTNQEKSALDKVVEVVWHKDDQTLADLKALQAKVDADIQRGNKGAVSGASAEIMAKTRADQAAMEGQNSVEFYSTSFLKAVPLFAGRSKVLMAASIGFNAMDAVKMKDNGGQVAADLALGGLKGFALKKTFDVLGSKQLSLGAEGSTLKSVSSVAGIGVKGIGIGGLSRLYDTGLNRQNWVNASGEVDPLNAVSMATRAALDGRSMALDATLFMGAHGVFSGLSKVGTRAIETSPALQRLESSAAGNFVKDTKLIPSATMGATFGFSSGAVGEVTREHQAGESFDLGKILKRGSYQALTDAAAGATGAGATRMTEIHGVNAAIAQAAKGRQMGMAFAGEDAPIVPEGKVPGEKVEVTQPPVVAEHPEVIKPEHGVQEHKMDAALQPIFEHSASLATRAVQPGAAAEDVVSFFKYTAGDGQHVRANMEDVARQAAQYGNTAMEALIKRAYEGTPEVAATLDTGLNLAQAASRHGASAEDHRAFLDYAYGQGKGAEVPLRIAAELTGDNAMDAMLQEAYAGANNLQRNPTGMVRISLNEMPPQAADVLKTILGHLPEDGLSHQLFRQNLHSWLDLVPQHADVVKQYAQQTRYGVIAAVVDAKLGTDYLSQFPERSLTNGNLLDKLRGVEHRASGDPADLEQVQPPQHVEPVEQPPAKPNPYEPAITHLPGEKVVNPERLIEEFYSSEGRGKQARAYLLTDFIREMNDQQFADWYAHGMQPSGRPDGSTNFQLMRMPGLDVLERPDVLAAVTDPSHSIVDLKTLKEFLSAPVKSADMPPAWQTDFIADRVELATQRLAMTAPPQVEGEAPQPIDPNKIVKEAVPSWFLKGLRERYSTYDRNAGTATYPMEFDDNLAQMLENQRYLERQNPKFRESTPPSNSFADRIATLEKALDVQKTTTAPELVPQLLKLGAADQPAVRGILDKLDLTTNAPEYTELLKIVVPRAENIQEVKTLLDAMYFGKKSDSTVFKARKDGKNADYAEKDRDANLALALTVAQKIAPSSEADGKRLQQIVSGVVSGKIRDPRPMMDGPGGPGGPGAGGKGGGREFRQRPNPPRDDRRVEEGPAKTVPADVTPPANNAPVEPIQPSLLETAAGGADLVRTAAGVGDVKLETILEGTGNTVDGAAHEVAGGLNAAAKEQLARTQVSEVDLTPIEPVIHHEPTVVRPVVEPEPEPDSGRRGNTYRRAFEEDDSESGGKDRRRNAKPKDKGHKRDRGGANSRRWQAGDDDYDP